ncbi:hypothetical protein ABZ302_31160 [Streptomyces sp. NPDC006237]
MLLFIAVGVGLGVLTFFAEKSYLRAVIAGVVVAGACAVGLHKLIA